MKKISYCKVNECDKRCHGHGFCYKHYTRWRQYGHPLKGKYHMGVGKTFEERFWSRVALTADDTRCWLWSGGANIAGYGTVTVNKQKLLAHHYAWILTYGHKPTMLLHACDTPACVNPKHLREGTDSDNVWDMMTRGRNKGQSLTAKDVEHVLHLLTSGMNRFQIHKQTGIHYHSVRHIADGTHWSLKLLTGGVTPSP